MKILMILIKSKAHQFGLEAQPPLVAGMVRALENLSPERILEAFGNKHELYNALKSEFTHIKETPTGLMITPEDLKLELNEKGIKTDLSPEDIAFIFAMLLLRNHGIITIPAVGMPGASATIRIDLASKDAARITTNEIVNAFVDTLNQLINIVDDTNTCKAVLYD